jgi:hypothetical protein
MNAAVAAIRVIDEGDPEAFRPAGRDTPGVTIVIRQVTEQLPAARIIDITPEREPRE